MDLDARASKVDVFGTKYLAKGCCDIDLRPPESDQVISSLELVNIPRQFHLDCSMNS